MRYLVTILALVPSIAHAYFNSILNESTIYQNKIITNNYQKYAAITLITDEQGGLKAGSLSTPKCDTGKELYNGKCEDTKCRKQYPFTTEPDKNKGNFTHYLCFGKYRYAYTSCKEDMGWIPEMNEYNTIHDCVERPGKEDYPLTEAEKNKVADFADTSCKYFGGVNRCRINSCNDGWDAERNGAGKIINCKLHKCPEEYYSAYKLDESVGTLLPPCKVGLTYKYGYERCNQGYSGPIKGQCYPKNCSASDGYVYTTSPIVGCKSGQTCYSGSSTYHRCTEPDDGYCMDADGFVNPCQCGAGYIYETSEIECCESVSEPCLSGDKKLYKCLKAGDGCYIDDDGKVNPNSCEGYDYETPNIPDCLETESCLSGDKTLYKCTKPKTCDGYPFEDKSTMTCFGTIEECTVGGKTYYKCTPTIPTIEYPCKNLKNEHHYLLPKGCYRQLFDRETGKALNECVFFAKAGCPAVVNDYIIGTVVAVKPKDKNGDELYQGILVAGLDTIDYEGKVTTEPTIWSSQVTKPLSTTSIPALKDEGAYNTGALLGLYKNNSVIYNVLKYSPECVDCEDYYKETWFLPSKYELQLAQKVTLLTRAIKIDSPQTDDSYPPLYITSTIEEGGKLANIYISVVYGYEEDSEPTITKIATYDNQSCSGVCVRKAYARPFTILKPNAMLLDYLDYDSPEIPSDDGNTTPSGGGGGGGRGGELLVDGPDLDAEDDDIISHEYLKWAN